MPANTNLHKHINIGGFLAQKSEQRYTRTSKKNSPAHSLGQFSPYFYGLLLPLKVVQSNLDAYLALFNTSAYLHVQSWDPTNPYLSITFKL